jgi:hypothetical protein
VNDRLRKTAGVEVERVTVGSADIRYDPGATNAEELAEIIADEGYTAFKS